MAKIYNEGKNNLVRNFWTSVNESATWAHSMPQRKDDALCLRLSAFPLSNNFSFASNFLALPAYKNLSLCTTPQSHIVLAK